MILSCCRSLCLPSVAPREGGFPPGQSLLSFATFCGIRVHSCPLVVSMFRLRFSAVRPLAANLHPCLSVSIRGFPRFSFISFRPSPCALHVCTRRRCLSYDPNPFL